MLLYTVDLLDGMNDTLEELFKLYREKIDALTEADAEELTDEFNLDDFLPEGQTKLEYLKGILNRAYTDFTMQVCHYGREVDFIHPPRSAWNGSQTVLADTGGLSWGDAPTELFNNIDYLYRGGIFDISPDDEKRIAEAVNARRANA